MAKRAVVINRKLSAKQLLLSLGNMAKKEGKNSNLDGKSATLSNKNYIKIKFFFK